MPRRLILMKAFLQFGVFLGVAVVFQPGLMTPAQGDDWPQWLGPHRDGLWRETGIVDGIPAGGLVLRWSTPIQGGYAGPSVADGRVYVTDFVPTPHARARAYGEAHENENYRRVSRVGHERLLCLREKDGHILWTHDHPTTYTHARLYANGPRTTPLVDGTCVYTLGAEGRLCCIDTETQAELWSHDLKADYHINAPTWGFATHPIIDGCQLITMVGGEGSAVVAFDKHTGQELWRSLSCRNPGYAQLTIETLGVHRQLLAWHGEALNSLNSLNPDTGRANWTFPVKPAHQMTIGMPRREGNKLYIMSWDCSRALNSIPNAPKPDCSGGPTIDWEWGGR